MVARCDALPFVVGVELELVLNREPAVVGDDVRGHAEAGDAVGVLPRQRRAAGRGLGLARSGRRGGARGVRPVVDVVAGDGGVPGERHTVRSAALAEREGGADGAPRAARAPKLSFQYWLSDVWKLVMTVGIWTDSPADEKALNFYFEPTRDIVLPAQVLVARRDSDLRGYMWSLTVVFVSSTSPFALLRSRSPPLAQQDRTCA